MFNNLKEAEIITNILKDLIDEAEPFGFVVVAGGTAGFVVVNPTPLRFCPVAPSFKHTFTALKGTVIFGAPCLKNTCQLSSDAFA